MTDPVECRYYGRDFSAAEMALLRELIAGPPALTRHALSREFCRRVGWYKTDGGLKDMMARVVMLAMHRDGRIELPPPQGPPSQRKPIVFGPLTEPPLLPPPDTLDAVRPLSLRTVVRGTRAGRLWNEFVARYHYLGYTTLVGAQMRYAVHAKDNRPLAMLGFSTAAWTLAPRDRFIGWSRELREKNLPLVIDNPRFLILPLGPHPQPRLPHPRPRPPPAAPRLDRTLQHHPRPHRNLRRDPALHRRRLPRLRLDPRRHHTEPRALRHQKTSTTSPKRTSGSGPCEGTGRPSSTVRVGPHTLTTERLHRSVAGVCGTDYRLDTGYGGVHGALRDVGPALSHGHCCLGDRLATAVMAGERAGGGGGRACGRAQGRCRTATISFRE